MFIVKNNSGEIIAYCSRLEDAKALSNTSLDNIKYIVEKVKV